MTLEWQPTVADVAGHLMARTMDASGEEQGTFTATTKPTENQVRAKITEAGGDVTDVLGSAVPADFQARAKGLWAIRAAMLAELSYYPADVAAGRSPYGPLKVLYDEGVVRLQRAMSAAAAATATSSTTGATSSFPTEPAPLGLSTRW